VAHHRRYRNRPLTTPEQEYAAVMDKIRSFWKRWKKEEDAEYDRYRSVRRTILQKLANRVIGNGVKLGELKGVLFIDPVKEAAAESLRLSMINPQNPRS
jgi:hypothetical protein